MELLEVQIQRRNKSTYERWDLQNHRKYKCN